ncbi:MAG: sigma-70 family RNA polymerase sigma factor [Gammaproteobacteria bacterium]|nr:sigma-70 family RNA polymerase sigma factor [Gammaproteobacteria bacterium]
MGVGVGALTPLSPGQAAAAADPAAWLDVHGDALYAYALTRVRVPAVAEDMVQETLLAALGSADRFRGESTERTWLIGILKHKVLDHLRRSIREQPLDEQVEEDTGHVAGYFDHTGHWADQPGAWGDPEGALQQEQFWNVLSDCMERLPERLRTLYALRELDGLETEELMRVLNISSRNNLWVMLSRTRLQLRQCLEANWFSP